MNPRCRALKALSCLVPILALAACNATAVDRTTTASVSQNVQYISMYGPIPDEKFPMPPMNVAKVDPKFFRQQVAYSGPEGPGTIVVDTQARFLYLVQPGGTAMRYGIGVGKEGLAFSGEAKIGRKAQWPRWTPTQSMIERDPKNAQWAGGMEPGLTNPLGPRAMYLYRNGRDTMFRIHGTSEPWSIGQAVSSGCIRLFNHDVIDLYNRVSEGTRVVVKQGGMRSNDLVAAVDDEPRIEPLAPVGEEDVSLPLPDGFGTIVRRRRDI